MLLRTPVQHIDTLLCWRLWHEPGDDEGDNQTDDETANVSEEGDTATVVCASAQRGEPIEELQHEPHPQHDVGRPFRHRGNPPDGDYAAHFHARIQQ